MKVQTESFHLDGHIIGFRPQARKLESPYKTPSSTLAVKGLLCRMIVVRNPIRCNAIEIKYTLTLGRSAYEMNSYSGAVPKPAIEDIMVHGRETASGSGATEPTR